MSPSFLYSDFTLEICCTFCLFVFVQESEQLFLCRFFFSIFMDEFVLFFSPKLKPEQIAGVSAVSVLPIRWWTQAKFARFSNTKDKKKDPFICASVFNFRGQNLVM